MWGPMVLHRTKCLVKNAISAVVELLSGQNIKIRTQCMTTEFWKHICKKKKASKNYFYALPLGLITRPINRLIKINFIKNDQSFRWNTAASEKCIPVIVSNQAAQNPITSTSSQETHLILQVIRVTPLTFKDRNVWALHCHTAHLFRHVSSPITGLWLDP